MPGPATTTVQGTLFDPSGNLVNGQAITPNPATFDSLDSPPFTIMQGSTLFYDVVEGVVDLPLIPYSNYTVKVEVTAGWFIQTWSVPVSPNPVSLAAVIQS